MMKVNLSLLKSRSLVICLAIVFIVMVGWADYAAGQDLQIVPLYLLPLGMAVWVAGWRWGMVLSVLAACTWLEAELAAGHVYSPPAAPFWNALMMLMVFSTLVLILSRLRAIMNTLDLRVKVRTAQLRDEMTKRYHAEMAQLRAERLAVVGSMAAQMAHEVRNPMGSISLNMELLSHEVATLSADRLHSPHEATILMSQMEREFGRIENVIRDYLGFVRLPKVMPQPQPLHAFLDERLALMAAEMSAAHVRLVKDYDLTIGAVNLDPVQMWQVLLNLVRNALEAMPQGGEVKIGTHREGDEVQISVSDSGCGIGESDIASVFKPFFTTKAQGTGLGLALSQQIVTEHGGAIECRSVLGMGTKFVISLPLLESSGRSSLLKFETSRTQSLESYEPHAAHSPS